MTSSKFQRKHCEIGDNTTIPLNEVGLYFGTFYRYSLHALRFKTLVTSFFIGIRFQIKFEISLKVEES